MSTDNVPFTSFPKIEQFRGVVADIKRYFGKDTASAPTIEFTGTVKIHGSNAGVGWNLESDSPLVPQSRKRLISVGNDNAGFAAFVLNKQAALKEIMTSISKNFPPEEDDGSLFIYGEWCGRGIQANVGIAELSQRLVIFNAAYRKKTADDNGDIRKHWLPRDSLNCIKELGTDADVYNIYDFPYWTKQIAFKQPELGEMQNELSALTVEVERECPIAKHFGVSGIGEGIVWTANFTSPHDGKNHNLRFKVKGEKHSVTKVKTLAAVDVEKLKTVEDFIAYAAVDNRLEQGFDELFIKSETAPTMKQMGQFIKWIRNDIVKEESDTMEASGIEEKDIGKTIAIVARAWFMKRLVEYELQV